MAESLYGTKNPSKTKHKPISSSTSLAFSSTLSSLISTSSSSTSRPRPAKSSSTSKSDIFTTHNKNVKKRSAADMSEDQSHQPQTKHDIGTVSTSELQRSKRKMEEKVRLYNAMKRGEYIGSSSYNSHDGLVDFDRKWADSELRGSRDSASEHSSDNSDSEGNPDPDPDSNANPNPDPETKSVEYTDEFGRLLHLTPTEARRHQRRQRLLAAAAQESLELSAHPERPSNIIYGDTIQHSAFNPDRIHAEKMEALAKKRDKEVTPPPEVHYDANWEIRNRGTGFYAFSGDEGSRRKEMESLERERQRTETERVRKEREKTDVEGQEVGTEKGKENREMKDAMDLLAEERTLRERERVEMKEREQMKWKREDESKDKRKKDFDLKSSQLISDNTTPGKKEADREADRFLDSLDLPPS